MNIILVNFYFIMVLQLFLHWQEGDCNTGSNFFQLAFILVLLLRIVVQEAFLNKALQLRTFKTLTLITSGCLLTALGVYQAYTMAKNSSYFDYNPDTKIGSLVCYQNRIVYVT